VVVAMNGGPPRGHAVNQLATIGQLKADPRGRLDRENRRRMVEASIRMPDMLLIKLDELLVLAGHDGLNPVRGFGHYFRNETHAMFDRSR